MKKFRRKQKKLYKIMRTLLIIAIVFLLVFIWIEPSLGSTVASIGTGICDILVIVALVFLFIYYNRYSKCDILLGNIEYEINDWGYYYSARKEKSIDELSNGILFDLKNDGYAVTVKTKINDLFYKFIATKRNELFYCTYVKNVKRDDVNERINSAINNATVTRLKRKGSLVLLIITDVADDSAIELSKMIVPIGKRGQFQAVVCIIEVNSKKCYFLGNKLTKCQQMILSYIMKCQSPIPETLKGERKLEYQKKLEEHMESYDAKDFKNGNFSAH